MVPRLLGDLGGDVAALGHTEGAVVSVVVSVVLALVVLRMISLVDRPVVATVRAESTVEARTPAPIEEPRALIRHRPAMWREEQFSWWRCSCVRIETDHQRALGGEHTCSLETWS